MIQKVKKWLRYWKYRIHMEQIKVWAEYLIEHRSIRLTRGTSRYEGTLYYIEKPSLGGQLYIHPRWESAKYLFIWDGGKVSLCHLGPWTVELENDAKKLKQSRFSDWEEVNV